MVHLRCLFLIVEKHHNRKEDAPSGTSKMLISAIQEVLPDVKGVFGRSGRSCKRQPGDIGVSSVRGGNIVSDHDVLFCGDSEVVTLAHHAQSNAILAEGAIFAAKKIVDIENGDVLFCGDSEVVTLAHHAQSNAILAEGAIFAAKKIVDIENGLYDMKDIL